MTRFKELAGDESIYMRNFRICLVGKVTERAMAFIDSIYMVLTRFSSYNGVY